MVSATLKGYWLYRNDAAVVLDRKIHLKVWLWKSFPWRFLERNYFIFINKHHPWDVTKLITGRTCFCLINPAIAMSQTMRANGKIRSVPLNIFSSVCDFKGIRTSIAREPYIFFKFSSPPPLLWIRTCYHKYKVTWKNKGVFSDT